MQIPVAIGIALTLGLMSHLTKAAQLRASTNPDDGWSVGPKAPGIKFFDVLAEEEKKKAEWGSGLNATMFLPTLPQNLRADVASRTTHSSMSAPHFRDQEAEKSKWTHKLRPKTLFCYAQVRTPCEELCEMLATQLNAGCDGWALFGDTDNEDKHVTKVYSKAVIPHALAHQMREMITQGVWKHLDESGALDKYEWFLKVDEDSFVRPSTLRKTFKALYPSSGPDSLISSHHNGAVISEGKNTPVEGFFVGLRVDAVLAIKAMGWPHECDEVLSGHNDSPDNDPGNPEPDVNDCFNRLGINRIGRLFDTGGHALVINDKDFTKNLSPNFVSVHGHPFRSPKTYAGWMKRFP